MNATQRLIQQMLAEAFTGTLQERTEGPQVGEKISEKDIANLLPTIKITERGFGNVGNQDRVVIEKFTASLGGTSTSVEEKLARINEILSGAKSDYNISQILTVMMVIETLSAILTEFTEAAGGFLFEGFLAGLFGGQSVQIESAADVARATGESAEGVSGKPITDVLLGGKHYSLKLLGAKTAVQGSFSNMIEHFSDFDHVVYLDARVTGERSVMEFSEFEITLENFLDIFYEPFKKVTQVVGKSAPLKTRQEVVDYLDSEEGASATGVRLANKLYLTLNGEKIFSGQTLVPMDKVKYLFPENSRKMVDDALAAKKGSPSFEGNYGPFVVEAAGTEDNFEASSKAVKLFGTPENLARVRQDLEQYRAGDKSKEDVIKWLRSLPGATNEEQFSFTPGQVEKIGNHKILGKLVVGTKVMQNMWMQYGELFKQTIEPVYRNLNEFTRNINSFFLDAPEGGTRFEHGRMAMTDAEELKTATDKVVGASKGFALTDEEKVEAASNFNLQNQSSPGVSNE